MRGHKIYVTKKIRNCGNCFTAAEIKRIILTALDEQGVTIPCEITVTVTDDKGIWQLNREFRNVDRPTDVLSFPMQDMVPGHFEFDPLEVDIETGRLPLGDIVISADRVAQQAEEYGHSLEREMAYLIVHSVLHLLGYDHVDEGPEKAQMRAREKAILKRLGIEDNRRDA